MGGRGGRLYREWEEGEESLRHLYDFSIAEQQVVTNLAA